MKIKSWNCTGIATKLNTVPFNRWLRDADIAALQETFLDTSALQVAGYVPFVKRATPPPPGKRHRATGGLVTLVSAQLVSTFSVKEVPIFDYQGFEWQCLRFERCDDKRVDLPSSFLILNCYVVSHPAAFDFNGLFFALEAYFLAHDVPVVMLGDFNAHWKLPLAASRIPSPRDRDFRDFVINLGDSGFDFYPSSVKDLRKPTYISTQGNSIIDYVFVKGVPSSDYRNEEVTVFGHRSQCISVSWPAAPATVLRDRTSHRKHFRVSPPSSFFADLTDGNSLGTTADFLKFGIAQVFSLFVLSLGSLFQVSRGPVGELAEPWHRYLSGAELEPLLRLEREVFDLAAGAQLGEVPWDLSTRNKELKQLRRALHSLASKRLFADVRGSYSDPTRLWAFVRKFRVRNDQGVLPIDTLAAHFSAVFNRVTDPVPMVFCERFFAVSDPLLDVEFTLDELDSAFRALERGTAPGVTGIGNDVLLELFHLPGGPQFFLNLFNACLEGGRLPDLWRCTEIFLLYKGKGDVASPGSYRGIALMESTLKLFERLLYNRLSSWARSRDLIPDCQFGFRRRSSTLDAVFTFFTILVKYVSIQGSQLFVCLVDFQKAFPSINRAQLLEKLEVLGVSSRFRRALCAIFVGNTFAIRQGHQVTPEYPVTTGLREGSVLSPLLFILFMSDIQDTVLRPFQRAHFLKRDPVVNGIPVPGLLYADDLVIFCLNADLLRERLRLLCSYADLNTLTVNVSKCEVVVFGRNSQPLSFKYKRQMIPVRRSCKYLGVWLDGDMSGRALASAITEKFVAAVPVFFSLCRRLRLARLDLVYRLANALVFSLLYGCEFLQNMEIVYRCEKAWWSGVRGFYGLPNGVSALSLKLLFPRVALMNRVLLAKMGLLFRGSLPLDTIFPEALVCDRAELMAVHRKGFSQSLREWCQFLKADSVFEAGSLAEARGLLSTLNTERQNSEWVQFSAMTSTAYAASLFASPFALTSTLVAASHFGTLGVRATLLSLTGSLTVSYSTSRFCLCGTKFSFEHFLSCTVLGPDRLPSLKLAIECKDWREAALIILSRFCTFLHALRGGNLREEENELFSQVYAVDEEDSCSVVSEIL